MRIATWFGMEARTYLTTNKIELLVANINCFRDGTNPKIVIFRVMKGHDGFYAGPNIIVRMDAKTTV